MNRRAWWERWLGAAPDPCARVEDGEPREVGVPGFRANDLHLHSHGDRLVATVLRPEPAPLAGVAGAWRPREPVVIVPFYEVATVLGQPCERTARRPRRDDQAYALHLARAGFSVVAVPWWFEQVAAGDAATARATALADRYGPAAQRHHRQLEATGLGRSVGDLRALVDRLVGEEWVDQERIGVFGHSLGAKLALHLAALDVRVAAAVAHEPGLGFAHSNWDDPWYLGAHVPRDRDQDELLALVAPRPILLAGGGDADGAHNRALVERARPAWGDDGGPDLLYHDGGHPMPPHVLAAGVRWLEGRLVPRNA